jgi:hypothetical protein
MTAIVTGTDGRSYVHEMAGEAPVFVTEPAGKASAPRAAAVGHARLVAWLVPMEAGGTRRARVRLPAGQIVEVAAEVVCSAANIARAGIGQARRPPAACLAVGHEARPPRSLAIFPGPRAEAGLRGVAALAVGSASSAVEAIGGRRRRPGARPTAR